MLPSRQETKSDLLLLLLFSQPPQVKFKTTTATAKDSAVQA